uniref:Stress-response A/B barrel domain-containing protein n=1 Tax=Kalanchoe fedtschenkoi TaxID=63787 RepID=A0A7N0UE46_KALFE
MLIRSLGPAFRCPSSSSLVVLKSSNPKPFHLCRRRCLRMMSSSIEHVVLFKVKDSTDSSKLSAMVDGLSGLTSLDQVLHLTAAPLHRTRSAPVPFTHLLHSRYGSKEDLAAYSAHPAHVAVVKEKVLPFCDDVMAVDWIADGDLSAPGPGSAVRLTLLKLKEECSDEKQKEEVLSIVRGCFDKVLQSSVGENFSPARAKGFTVASLAVYRTVEDLEEADNSALEAKVRPYIDDIVDVEYVIPYSSANL